MTKLRLLPWCNYGLRNVAVLLALLLGPLGVASAAVAHPCPEHLFVIERSKNANIVVYDANRGPGGDFSASNRLNGRYRAVTVTAQGRTPPVVRAIGANDREPNVGLRRIEKREYG